MWAGITVARACVFTLLVYLLFDRSWRDEVAAEDKNLKSMGRADNRKENGGDGAETLLVHCTTNYMTANGACGKAVFDSESISSISGSYVGDSVCYSVGYGGTSWG